jgi:hypothetical protein
MVRRVDGSSPSEGVRKSLLFVRLRVDVHPASTARPPERERVE